MGYALEGADSLAIQTKWEAAPLPIKSESDTRFPPWDSTYRVCAGAPPVIVSFLFGAALSTPIVVLLRFCILDLTLPVLISFLIST